MTRSGIEIVVRNVHLGLVWGASLLVPASKRSEWLEEWRAELWYVLRECSSITSDHPRSMKRSHCILHGSVPRRNLASEAIMAKATALVTNLRFGSFLCFWPCWNSLRTMGNRPTFTSCGCGSRDGENSSSPVHDYQISLQRCSAAALISESKIKSKSCSDFLAAISTASRTTESRAMRFGPI